VRTALRFLIALFRGRALELEGPTGRFHLFPDGTLLPVMAGADGPTPEEEAEAAREAAEEERAEAEAEAARIKKAEEEGVDPEDLPKFEGDFDREKAERAIAHLKERNRDRAAKAKAELDKANARAAELEREKETEQERVTREAGEAKAEAARERANTERLTIDAAIRDAAADADVPAKTIKRLVRLVDRDEISVDGDGEVDGATEAVEAFLTEFPEFKGKPAVEPTEEEEEEPEPAGGNPSRKKKPPKELTAEQVQKLAKDDPEKFNELYEAGKIPAKALAGIK
jgi:hypothetical protein